MTYYGVSFFHVLLVEDVLAGICFWRSFPVGWWGGNLLVGQYLPKLGGSIDGHTPNKCRLKDEMVGMPGGQRGAPRKLDASVCI